MVGDAGIKLSGGQRQRLAIARSIVKRPKILILDEATSSIDVRSEQIVQAALEKVSRNRTTLVIAHRLGTIRKADNIIVLRKGKAIQQGTHEELMGQKDGAYWTLATAQQLAMGSEEETDELNPAPDAEPFTEKKSMATIATDNTLVETTTTSSGDDAHKPADPARFWTSFAVLLREQSQRWRWYIVLLLGAMGGGGRSSFCRQLSEKLRMTKVRSAQPVNRSKHTCLLQNSLCSSSGVNGFQHWRTSGA